MRQPLARTSPMILCCSFMRSMRLRATLPRCVACSRRFSSSMTLGGDERRGAGHRIAAVAARGGDALEAFLELLAHGDAGDGEAVAEALAHGDHVGHDAPVFHGQPLAGAAPAREDLVGHEEDFAVVAELAQLREEVVRRHDRAAPALDRLEDEAGDGTDGGLVEVFAVELNVGIRVDRAVRLGPDGTVGIGARHHMGAGGTDGAIDVRADVAEGHGAVRLAVEVMKAAHGPRACRKRRAARGCRPRPRRCRNRRVGNR